MHELLERSIKEASTYFQNFFIHEYSEEGALHKVDARIKILGTLLLIVLSVSTFDVEKVVFVILSLVAVAWISKISLKIILSRIWLFSLFTFIVVLPLSVNDPEYGIVFTLRVVSALIAIQILIITTPFNEVVYALRSFKLPELFTSALWLAYRYVLLMFTELIGILMARESRRVAKTGHFEVMKKGGQALGLFFVRSFERAERVQLAMAARGDKIVPYRGRLKNLDGFYLAILLTITIWWVIL